MDEQVPTDPSRSVEPLRYALLGCESKLTLGVLAELTGTWAPATVVLAGYAPLELTLARTIPVDAPAGGVAGHARARGIPVLALGSGLPSHRGGLAEESRAGAAARGPDLFVVACFPYILGPEWLGTPRFGVLNVHPSLLPAYRGPSPLHWQQKHKVRDTGVTVHWATSEVDGGAIVAQASFPLHPNAPAHGVVRRQAMTAGALLRVVLKQLGAGRTAAAALRFRARAQPRNAATWFGWPS